MTSFERGTFRDYRVTFKLHIPPVAAGKPETDLTEGSVIQYDGYTFIKDDEKWHGYPQLQSAIKRGWLVPADAEYVEETEVEEAPSRVAPPARVATMSTDHNVVAKLKPTTTVGGGGVVATASARAQDFVGASAKASAGSIDDGAKTGVTVKASSGSIPGNYSDGDVVGKVGPRSNVKVARTTVANEYEKAVAPAEDPEEKAARVAAARARAEAERAARKAAADKGNKDPLAAPKVTVTPTDDVVAEPVDPKREAKLRLVREVLPQFDWDTSLHWMSRAKVAVQRYESDPVYLLGILAVESDAVRAEIQNRLKQK
jgi:hypothetical protein